MTIAGERTIRYHIAGTADGRAMIAAGRDMDRAADAIERMDRASVHAGRGVHNLDHDFENLNRTIGRSRDKITELHRAIARSGGTDNRLFGDLRAEERNLRRLERTALAVGAMKPGGGNVFRGGGWMGTGLDFSQGLSESRGVIIAGLVGVVAAALPTIGAMVGGAVTGAAGLGGIVGGVIAAFQDPRVQGAWERFAESFSADDFGRAAFVKPTIAALDELQSAFRDLDLGDSLAKVAPFVDVIAKGIGDLAREFMPGFNAALDDAGPFLEVLSKELGDTGKALGDMLADMASSEGSVEGLVALFDLLEGVLVVLGQTVNTLADTWDFMTDVAQGATGGLEKFLGVAARVEGILSPVALIYQKLGFTFGNVHDHFERVNNDFSENQALADKARSRWAFLTGASEDLTMALDAQRDALRLLGAEYENYYNIAMGVDEANQSVNKAWLRLRDSLDENKKHWETNTREGLANRDAVLGVVSALNQQREAAITAAGDSIEGQQAANRTYEQGIKELEKWAAAHGLVGAALQDLVKEYGVTEFELHLKGTIDAAAYAILAMAGKKLSSVLSGGSGPTSTATSWQQARGAWQGPGFASGGMAPANTPVVIGEHSPAGPMLTMFRRPTYIMPDSGSAGGGGGNITATVVGGGGRFEDLIAEIITRHVQFNYGGNVVKMTSRTAR